MQKKYIVSLVVAAVIALALFLGQPAVSQQVTIGAPAPQFTLAGSDGKNHSLAQYKGSIVVLEWLNHECPFVKKHYSQGAMQRLQKSMVDKGIVWLSINSSAPGKQGHLTKELAVEVTAEKKATPTVVLLDGADGAVGKSYGARTTPHMFVIDKQGNVAYAGAIDSNSSSDPATIPDAVNYVAQAVDELLAGKAVSLPTTKSYGCSVKY